MALTDKEVRSLQERANDIRESIIKMLVDAGSGHTTPGLSGWRIFLPRSISIF